MDMVKAEATGIETKEEEKEAPKDSLKETLKMEVIELENSSHGQAFTASRISSFQPIRHQPNRVLFSEHAA